MHPSIVLSAYIEPLLRGRRVAVLGDATLGLADELNDRGARLVHAYDPDAARTAEALARSVPGRPHHVTYGVFDGDLGVRDGAFDVVIVPDLSLFTDAVEVLRRVRRLVSPTGAAVLVAPNAARAGRRLVPTLAGRVAPPGYYELYDLVSLQFPRVKMVGQAPFVGYTVAEFAVAGEPDVAVDTSFLQASEEPEFFIAIASERAVALDPYTVIELPWAEVAEALGPAQTAQTSEAHEDDRLALTEARARLVLMTAEFEKVREQHLAGLRAAETRGASSEALSSRVAELELEAQAREAKAREIEARAGDNHVRAERASHQIRDLEEELRRQRDRGVSLTKQLDDEKRARTKAELDLGLTRGRPEIAGAKDRLDALTAEIEAARARIAELESDQAETLRQLQAQAAPPTAVIDAGLIRRLTELEAALNAARGDAADAEQERDTAEERARKAEVRAHRVVELEATLEATVRTRTELATENRRLAALVAAGDPRAVDAEKRAVDAERHLAESRTRAADLERTIADARSRLADAEQRLAKANSTMSDRDRELAASRARAGELATRVAGVETAIAAAERRESAVRASLAAAEARAAADGRRLAELDAKLAELDRLGAARDTDLARAALQAAELIEAKAAADAATAEIPALEAALRERGQLITALRRDLRESERIGRELVGELDVGHTMNGAAHEGIHAAPRSEEASVLRERLDTLAAAAARAEADLQAATWRVAQLEREVRETAATPPAPSEVQRQLEEALAAARNEVAALRRGALG